MADNVSRVIGEYQRKKKHYYGLVKSCINKQGASVSAIFLASSLELLETLGFLRFANDHRARAPFREGGGLRKREKWMRKKSRRNGKDTLNVVKKKDIDTITCRHIPNSM